MAVYYVLWLQAACLDGSASAQGFTGRVSGRHDACARPAALRQNKLVLVTSSWRLASLYHGTVGSAAQSYLRCVA